MAKLIDLDEEDVDAACDVAGKHHSLPLLNKSHIAASSDLPPNPNVGLFSAALVCYPIASQLASYLDLNSLHDLSRTCRQFRASLLLYRNRLVAQTLQCENEHDDPAIRLGNALHASHQVWTAYGREGIKIGRITSGKIGACARDSVGECRRCGTVVCRNCIMKPPPSANLKGRHRRLCRTCMKCPLDHLSRTTPQACSSSPTAHHHQTDNDFLAQKVFSRTPCLCESDFLWICKPCGQTLRSNDITYSRGLVWRTRYSQIGGMGAGLGEGNEGVECGRNSDFRCLAATDVVQEIECDGPSNDESDASHSSPGGMASDRSHADAHTTTGMTDSSPSTPVRHWAGGSSYTTAEIVGIGGGLKTKVRKRVTVGAVVKVYKDERASGKFLAREQTGVNRSWCSWCARVVPGKKDKAFGGEHGEECLETSSDSSSGRSSY